MGNRWETGVRSLIGVWASGAENQETSAAIGFPLTLVFLVSRLEKPRTFRPGRWLGTVLENRVASLSFFARLMN